MHILASASALHIGDDLSIHHYERAHGTAKSHAARGSARRRPQQGPRQTSPSPQSYAHAPALSDTFEPDARKLDARNPEARKPEAG